jgi:hypothetical protein
MKLKEKFKSLNTNFGRDTKYYHHNLKKCEKIADEFAIEFAKWSVARAIGLDSFKLNNGELETFKKDKGL